jgi:hypothetical protein
MYLMWNSHLDSASIDVPLGYATWGISGTAKNAKTTPPWSLSSQGTTTTKYTPSTDTGAPAHGLPVWSNIVYGSSTTSEELESTLKVEEEEKKQ